VADRPRGALNRPTAMRIDPVRCVDCGACDDLAPGMRAGRERIAIDTRTLEAMAACPVGAILWLEGETHEQDPRRP